jgi:hypothetical protein
LKLKLPYRLKAFPGVQNMVQNPGHVASWHPTGVPLGRHWRRAVRFANALFQLARPSYHQPVEASFRRNGVSPTHDQ